MLIYYRLDALGLPVPEPDKYAWAEWIQHIPPLLSQTFIGEIAITTKFIGFSSKEPPEVWQTEIRGSLLDGKIFPWPGSRDDAEIRHNEVVQMVKEFLQKHKKL